MNSNVKSFYRIYRPKSFDAVVGQEFITRTLSNQIASQKIGHAYLFCGTRGTGKTSVAKIFADAVNCENFKDGKVCGQCAWCQNPNKSMDIFEIDAASNNGVDAVRDLIESVKYPGLEGDEDFDLAKKYLKGASGVISIVIKGGRETAMKFMNSLKLASNEVHVADIRTCVLHPASETHRQLTDEQLVACGIEAGMVRFSVGLENVEDILADVEQALANI